ncbi:DUF5316 domain-containing protein [Clostridium sp. C2-6-12]|uniref:DUF5316 domain-containing protein n=1 Tax=Clostridium sp. C2-6-12 TaxID=2698832 RepID=UPI00136A9F50|nr:DUF5316 domain-containing protein [Clostridium sp. C2-6-12]
MKASFIIGLFFVIIANLIGFFLNDYTITLKITGIIVAGAFIVAGILNGSFISGEMYRNNFLSETKDDRNNKMKIIKYVLLFSIPNLLSIIVLLIIK